MQADVMEGAFAALLTKANDSKDFELIVAAHDALLSELLVSTFRLSPKACEYMRCYCQYLTNAADSTGD